jgi:hypothetical protein
MHVVPEGRPLEVGDILEVAGPSSKSSPRQTGFGLTRIESLNRSRV